MELLHKFVGNHHDRLIQLYITERQTRGNGLLMLTLADVSETVRAIYVEDCNIPEPLQHDLDLRRFENAERPEVIFFYLCTPDSAEFFAVNLATRCHLDSAAGTSNTPAIDNTSSVN